MKISPVQMGWERVVSVLLQEVNPPQQSWIHGGHSEGSHRNEGLQQSVQGQRAGYPQLMVFFSRFFWGGGIWACELIKVDGMVEMYPS